MSLKPCPECQVAISTKAGTVCPGCGYNRNEDEKQTLKIFQVVMIVAGVIVVLSGAQVLNSGQEFNVQNILLQIPTMLASLFEVIVNRISG